MWVAHLIGRLCVTSGSSNTMQSTRICPTGDWNGMFDQIIFSSFSLGVWGYQIQIIIFNFLTFKYFETKAPSVSVPIACNMLTVSGYGLVKREKDVFESATNDISRLFYLVSRQVINNAREIDVASLGYCMVFQRGQKLRFWLLGHLTCNKTKDNCIELATR